MFKHIMVPVNGSELAERALPCAQRLAMATGATVHLTRVVAPLPEQPWAIPAYYVPAGLYETDVELANDELRSLRARLDAAGVASQVTCLSTTWDVGVALLDYERRAGIDLVVMATHERPALRRWATNSVAERLAGRGGAPVLLARSWGAAFTLEHAVVPLDGSDWAEGALAAVEQLVPAVVRRVTLLRVVATPAEGVEAERYLARVVERLRAAGSPLSTQASVECRVAQGQPARAILEVASATSLVVMAPRHVSGLAAWALNSVTDKVARGGAAAVLIARPAASAGEGRAAPVLQATR